MKKKAHIHCNVCHNIVTVAKKGKHRYFICPQCGVIAYNPVRADFIKNLIMKPAQVGEKALIGTSFLGGGEESTSQPSPHVKPHHCHKSSDKLKLALGVK